MIPDHAGSHGAMTSRVLTLASPTPPAIRYGRIPPTRNVRSAAIC